MKKFALVMLVIVSMALLIGCLSGAAIGDTDTEADQSMITLEAGSVPLMLPVDIEQAQLVWIEEQVADLVIDQPIASSSSWEQPQPYVKSMKNSFTLEGDRCWKATLLIWERDRGGSSPLLRS